MKDHGRQIAKALKMRSTPAYSLKDNMAITVSRDHKITFEKFEPMESFKPYTSHWNDANKALGNALTDPINHSSRDRWSNHKGSASNHHYPYNYGHNAHPSTTKPKHKDSTK